MNSLPASARFATPEMRNLDPNRTSYYDHPTHGTICRMECRTIWKCRQDYQRPDYPEVLKVRRLEGSLRGSSLIFIG